MPTDALPESVAGIDVPDPTPDPSAAPDPDPTPADTQQQSDTQQQDAAPDPTPATPDLPTTGPGGIPQDTGGIDPTPPDDDTATDTDTDQQAPRDVLQEAATQFNRERGVGTELAGIDVGGERAEQIADTAEQQFGVDVPDPVTADDLQVAETDGQRVVETTDAYQREQVADRVDDDVPTEIRPRMCDWTTAKPH